ncbi:MAG: thioesterase [Bacteroidetes bacterium]|jgi:acyl-CoA thioester hydrolase|nr:thioesterase [Bacteroidota bacterium]
MHPGDFKHQFPIQLRFIDIDKLGHVNNAVYHSYFEMARVAYFDDLLGDRVDWKAKGMILAKALVDFKIPVRLSDKITCYTKVSRIGTKSFDLSNLLVKAGPEGQELIAAEAVYTIVCMNYETQQTIVIPDNWLEAIRAFEGM